MRSLLKITTAFSAVALMASSLQAQVITVPNFSFEDPAVSGDHYAVLNNDSTFIPDWTFNDTSSVSGTLDNRFALSGMPGTSDGSRVAFFNVGPGLTGTATTNGAVTTIAAGESYTLTVALGNTAGTSNFTEPGTFTLSLGTGSATAFTTITSASLDAEPSATNTGIADGTIQDFSVTLSALQAAPFIGQGLFLRVTDTDTLGNNDYSQALFDNVRLTDTAAVPEPSTWAMLFGGLGLLVLIQRRRLRA